MLNLHRESSTAASLPQTWIHVCRFQGALTEVNLEGSSKDDDWLPTWRRLLLQSPHLIWWSLNTRDHAWVSTIFFNIYYLFGKIIEDNLRNWFFPSTMSVPRNKLTLRIRLGSKHPPQLSQPAGTVSLNSRQYLKKWASLQGPPGTTFKTFIKALIFTNSHKNHLAGRLRQPLKHSPITK